MEEFAARSSSFDRLRMRREVELKALIFMCCPEDIVIIVIQIPHVELVET
jgi:hypothetical protein